MNNLQKHLPLFINSCVKGYYRDAMVLHGSVMFDDSIYMEDYLVLREEFNSEFIFIRMEVCFKVIALATKLLIESQVAEKTTINNL